MNTLLFFRVTLLLLFVVIAAEAQNIPLVAQNSGRRIERREARTGLPLNAPLDPRSYVSYREDEQLVEQRLRKYLPAQKVLQPCAKSDVRRRKIGPAVVSARAPVDVVIYNSTDPAQRERANRWQGDVLGFIPGEDYRAAVKAAPIKSFLLTSEAACLPTRIHYISEGGAQYKEFREGSAAWEIERN